MHRSRNSALIINAYSAKNAGDAAIILATSDLLKDQGVMHVTSATRYYADDRIFYEPRGVNISPPLIPFPERGHAGNITRVCRFVVGVIGAGALASLHKIAPQMSRWLALKIRLPGLVAAMDTSCVVICGGGYMYSSRRRINLALIHSLLSIFLCRILGKQMIMMPQSIGPLPKRLDRWLTRIALGGINPVVARDQAAVSEAENLLVGRSNSVTLCPDIAFYGWASIRTDDIISNEKLENATVGIVVMDWTWARPVDPQTALADYTNKIVDAIMMLNRFGVEVVLLGHSRLSEHEQDDLVVAKQIVDSIVNSEMGPPSIVDLDSDPERISFFLATLSVVVGTRLHSCILSMVSGTPAIALAYQPKAVGTYKLLGLSDLCLDVERFTSEQLVTIIMYTSKERPRLSKKVRDAVGDAQDRITKIYTQVLSVHG